MKSVSPKIGITLRKNIGITNKANQNNISKSIKFIKVFKIGKIPIFLIPLIVSQALLALHPGI